MSITYHDSTGFIIANLNAALEEHLAWSRKVLRCAVLHELPSNDVLDPMAHTLCGFSRWYALNKVHFYELDSDSAFHLEAVHKTMHDAIRAICSSLQTNEPGSRAEMERFEQAQTEFIELISQFKTGFLTEAAMHDPLTGLRLRFGVESEFSQIQKTCLRNNLQLYSAIIDIDHFKWVNDRYGHPIGDQALRHLADTLQQMVRPNEPLIRWGGEEFLLLIQCAGHGAALVVAERIVNVVRSTPLVLEDGNSIFMTVTVGLAQVQRDETLASAVERADRALYAGKEAGRDRYMFAQDSPPSHGLAPSPTCCQPE